jgi:hypothetical protein
MVASVNNRLDMKSEELDKTIAAKKSVEDISAGYQAQISQLNSQILAMRKQHDDVLAVRESRIVDRDNTIADLKKDLFASQITNLFILGSPYPVGLDKVRLGDPVTKIAEAYPYKNQSDVSSHLSFKLPSDVFEWLSFDYNVEKTDVVDAVTLDIGELRSLGKNPKPPLPDGWLEASLRRSLGKPIAEIGPGKRCLIWRVDTMDRTLVSFRKGDSNYVISNVETASGCYFTPEQKKEFPEH